MTDAELGARIAMLRQSAHLTQEQLGAAAELDRAQMCKIEKGERKLTGRELISFARALSCDIDAVLFPEYAGSALFRAAASASGADADLAWLRRFRRRYDDVVQA